MIVQLRAFVTIPGLPFEDEQRWEPLIEHLEREVADVGPVLAFEPAGAQVIVSFDADHQADAAERAVGIVTDGLRAVGLTELYPAGVELEPAGEPVAA